VLFFFEVKVFKSDIMVKTVNLKSVMSLPGATGLPFIGESLEIYLKEHCFYWERYQRYGSNFKTQLLGEKIAVLSEPEAYRDVFLTSPKSFSNYVGWKILEPFIGRGILLEDGEAHKLAKNFISPSFHKTAIHKYLQIMNVKSITLLEQYQWQIVNLGLFVRLYTLPVILSVIFGTENPSLILRLAKLFEDVLYGFRDIFRIPVPNEYTNFGKSLIARNEIELIIKEQLDKRIHDNDFYSSDLISIFADAYVKKIFSYEKVVELLLQLLMGGHDTSANLLFWLVNMLESHQEIKNNLSDEIKYLDSSTVIKTSTLLHSTINETLRLFPSVPYLPRGVMDDVVVSNIEIPKGWSLYLCPLITHRNPKYYRSPSRFMPDRSELKNPTSFTFIPFGAGVHSCLGAEFAISQVKVFLFHLFKYKWTVTPTYASTTIASPFKIDGNYFVEIHKLS
jgi:retinoid hydroxylase